MTHFEEVEDDSSQSNEEVDADYFGTSDCGRMVDFSAVLDVSTRAMEIEELCPTAIYASC